MSGSSCGDLVLSFTAPSEKVASECVEFDLSVNAEGLLADTPAPSEGCDSDRSGERLLSRPCVGLRLGERVVVVAEEETMLALARKDEDGTVGFDVDGVAKANWGLCPTNGASSGLSCSIAAGV